MLPTFISSCLTGQLFKASGQNIILCKGESHALCKIFVAFRVRSAGCLRQWPFDLNVAEEFHGTNKFAH